MPVLNAQFETERPVRRRVPAPEPKQSDRDTWTREAGGIQISASLESGAPLPTIVQQLSRTDVQFLTDRPVRFGTRLRLAMFVDFATAAASNVAVVHWCRPESGGWRVGAFLTSPLPPHLIERCWWELRSQIRYEANWRAWVGWSDSGQRSPVQITDYSVSGMCLDSPVQPSPNRRLWLYQNSAENSDPLLDGKIQWVRKTRDRWLAGCYLYNQRGRYLPRAFNRTSILHIEVPDLVAGGSAVLLPQAAEWSADNRLV